MNSLIGLGRRLFKQADNIKNSFLGKEIGRLARFDGNFKESLPVVSDLTGSTSGLLRSTADGIRKPSNTIDYLARLRDGYFNRPEARYPSANPLQKIIFGAAELHPKHWEMGKKYEQQFLDFLSENPTTAQKIAIIFYNAADDINNKSNVDSTRIALMDTHDALKTKVDKLNQAPKILNSGYCYLR